MRGPFRGLCAIFWRKSWKHCFSSYRFMLQNLLYIKAYSVSLNSWMYSLQSSLLMARHIICNAYVHVLVYQSNKLEAVNSYAIIKNHKNLHLLKSGFLFIFLLFFLYAEVAAWFDLRFSFVREGGKIRLMMKVLWICMHSLTFCNLWFSNNCSKCSCPDER